MLSFSKTCNKLAKFNNVAQRSMATAAAGGSDQPKRVLVSGAAGNIAYSIVYRIAS